MKRREFCAVLVLLLALGASAAWSQATLTRAEGKVVNAGKPVPDVQVVLTFQDSGKQFKVKTDKSGAFFLIGLTRGAYTVEVFNATGQSLYQKKNQTLMGEGGAVDQLNIDVAGEGGNGGQPKVTAEQLEAIKAQNAKALSINALINQYNAANAAKDWAGAITPLQGMIAADPTRWDYIQALGNMQLNAGQYDDAVQSYEKGIQVAQGYVSGATPKDPKNPITEPAKAKAGVGQMLTSEGNAYLKLKKNPEAIAAFTKAAEMDPNPGIAYFNICATQYNAGNMEGAAAACDKAIQADPNKAEAYFIKGSAMYGNGKLDANNKYVVPPGTTDALKKYLELAPDGAHANDVKAMLDALGQTMETTYKGTKKK
jgi:tetratricopeptide (TPR) repeat protein